MVQIYIDNKTSDARGIFPAEKFVEHSKNSKFEKFYIRKIHWEHSKNSRKLMSHDDLTVTTSYWVLASSVNLFHHLNNHRSMGNGIKMHHKININHEIETKNEFITLNKLTSNTMTIGQILMIKWIQYSHKDLQVHFNLVILISLLVFCLLYALWHANSKQNLFEKNQWIWCILELFLFAIAISYNGKYTGILDTMSQSFSLSPFTPMSHRSTATRSNHSVRTNSYPFISFQQGSNHSFHTNSYPFIPISHHTIYIVQVKQFILMKQ